ncbi:MAG: NYN domain-containing protein [Nitrospira sp.]|nr:NYN domain-containing protein [Nitrospira sp.]
MSTYLIIDGYNLLGAMRGWSEKLESAREDLLEMLAAYRHRKRYDITVVFDGWQHDRPVEQHDRYGGVQVVYSKRGEKADQVIQRLVRHYGPDCALVTSDREIIRVAHVHGAFVLEAREFAAKLQGTLSGVGGPMPHKELDSGDDDRPGRGSTKRGNPRKLPKAERRRQHQLKRF